MLVEDADPEDFGFVGYKEGFIAKEKISFLRGELYEDKDVGVRATFWMQIHDRLVGRPITMGGEFGKFLYRLR